MGKLNVNVGDEVYLKCTISRIEKRKYVDEEDYFIEVEFPDWFYDTGYGSKKNKTDTVMWNQHLLFTPNGEEA